MRRLGVDYVDLLYIHQPAGNWLAGYRQLEKAYKEGKAKSIGISNFEGEFIAELETKWDVFPSLSRWRCIHTLRRRYDTIVLAYPNYWGTMPMAVFTFLEKYDFTGRTILPLCTNEGSGMGGSERDIFRHSIRFRRYRV